ncbi:MAG TPA: helix-turn-helix transcriptional regulator [Bacillota bacterium]|jgi:transcriptional regulator with XRE-family HTH domain|nr:helix-turn-helix transcriptional regulator [Bacillota bacterium]HQE65610.1 helix-turn-helix transcriptional regulator [Bacillota bacterium]HQI16619.1 helix-turn-helix transcriptional regulator [Bacillota bacterium]HQJ38302.1 helix-turn-helix transcriptional regulator [Bacillota bacterium]HRU41552.1 helix-turn-helix transcriptional regulator [Candidatus Diapherotrites archaeon]
MEFGERLRDLREEKNLTRHLLADKLNVSYSTISKYETNIRFPDKGTLIALADFFDVSLDYLLCRSDIKDTADKTLNKCKEQFLVNSSGNRYSAYEGLSPEAVEEIEKFKEFVQHKYGKK